MIIAIQFDPADQFITLRNTLRQRLSLPSTSVILPTLGLQTFFVDALIVEQNTSAFIGNPDPNNTRGIPVVDSKGNLQPTANMDAVVFIKQPVTARLYTLDELINAKDGGIDPGPGKLETFDVIFEMAVDLSQPSPSIVISLQSILHGNAEVAELKSALAFAPVANALNFSALSQFIQTPSLGLDLVTRGGVSLFLGKGLLTIALELGNIIEGVVPSPTWDWSSFNEPSIGMADNLCGGNKFGLILDGRILVGVLEDNITSGLHDKIVQGSLKLKQPPSGFWGLDRAIVSFEGAVVDACALGALTHNLNFRATLAAIPLVPQDDLLRLDIQADFKPDDGDQVVCAFSIATFPLNSVKLAQDFGLDGGMQGLIAAVYFSGIVGFVAIFSGTLVAINKFDPLGELAKQMPSLHEVKPTSHSSEAFWDLKIQLPTINATPVLRNIGAHPMGPILKGDFALAPQERLVPSLETSISPLAWQPSPPCSTNVVIGGEADFRGHNSPLLGTITAMTIYEDPLNQFSPFAAVDGNFITISIPQASVQAAYLQSPYDCRILVFTTLGVRLINLGSIVQITQQQLDEIKHAALDPNCLGIGSRILAQGHFDVSWLVDPGPDTQPARLWNVAVNNLPAGNTIIASISGHTLGTSNAVNRFANFSILLPPTKTQSTSSKNLVSDQTSPNVNTLGLTRTGPAPSVEPGQKNIRVVQAELQLTSRFILPHGCEYLSMGYLDGHTIAMTTDQFGLSVWDLSKPQLPFLRCQFSGSGIAGAMLTRNQILAWGKRGIANFKIGDLAWKSRFSDRVAQGVIALEPYRDGYLVLTSAKLLLIDAGRNVTSAVALNGGKSMVLAGKQVIVSCSDSSLQNIELNETTLRIARRTQLAVQSLGPAQVIGYPNAFYARISSSDHGVFVFDNDGLQRLNSYPIEPWFAASQRLGRYLLVLSPGRTIVSVYVATKTRRFTT